MTVHATLLMLLLVGAAAPVAAGPYSGTITDDQEATIAEHLVRYNARIQSTKRAPEPAQTRDDVIRGLVRYGIEQMERSQTDAAFKKPFLDRSAHEKRLACRRDKLDPCPQ